MKTALCRKRRFAALLCAAAFRILLAPAQAEARETNARFQLTCFGGIVFPQDGEGCAFVPQDPPELLDAGIYDNSVLELGGATGTAEFALAASFRSESGNREILAFLGGDESAFVFLSSKREVMALIPIQDAGIVAIPYDYGDTRDERAAEMAGGAVPQVDISMLDDILAWISANGEAMASLSKPADSTAKAAAPSVSGKTLFSGSYTTYGALMREPMNPMNSGESFQPVSPPNLVEIEVREKLVSFTQDSAPGASYEYSGELPLKTRTFRVYASQSGAEHVVVSPTGDVVHLAHIPGWLYMAIFYDRGDTRKTRLDQMQKAPGRCPPTSFPDFAEVAKWSFAQPVRAVNPPPGGGGGGGAVGGGGGGLCSACRGRGTIMKFSPTYGTRGPWFCADCGGSSYFHHYHTRCMSCGGSGRQ